MLSERSRYAGNPIEEEDRLADKLEKQHKRIIRLNRGDPTKYFPTPDYIIKEYMSALKGGKTSYGSADGIYSLRDAVSKRYKRLYRLNSNADDILITAGVSEALSFLNSALINNGDSAILFRPYYTMYVPHLKINGGNIIMEEYDEADNWSVNTDKLKKSLEKLKNQNRIKNVKYMMVTNPNNPTGTVLKRNTLKEIVDIANEYNILLVSDEIYDEIVYNKMQFTSISELAKGIPYIILNGSSKVFDSTGFRIGFLIVPEDDKKSNELKKILYNYTMMRLSVNLPAQYAIAEAINNIKEHRIAIKKMVKEIEKRVNYATDLLAENPYLRAVRPNGAFYILPRVDFKNLRIKNDRKFTELLLKKEGIQVTRGSGFGADSHIRIVALTPKEILDYAINRINVFCKSYSR